MRDWRLDILFKELPWLESLGEEMGNPSIVRVRLFDRGDLDTWVGHANETRWARCYLFDNVGTNLGPLHPTQSGFTGWLTGKLRRIFFDITPSADGAHVAARWIKLKDALKLHPRVAEIMYVVIFGRDLFKGELCIKVLKVPRGKTVQDILTEKDERDRTSALKYQEFVKRRFEADLKSTSEN